MFFSKMGKLGRQKKYISVLIVVKTDFSKGNCLMDILLGKTQVQAPVIV